MFSQFFENQSNGINVGLALVLGIDENIIRINNNENIKFFGQDLIDIILETGWYIRELQRHYLVLKVAESSPEGFFPFIAFFYPYLMISTREIELAKLFGLI